MKFVIAALALASVKACPDPFVGGAVAYEDDKCTKEKTDVDEAGKKAYLEALNKAMADGLKGGACQTESDVNWQWACDDKGAKVSFYKTNECKETIDAPQAALDQMKKDGILQEYLYDTCYPVVGESFFAKYSAPAKGGDDDKDGDDKEGDDKEAGAKTMAVSMMAALAIAASQF